MRSLVHYETSLSDPPRKSHNLGAQRYSEDGIIL